MNHKEAEIHLLQVCGGSRVDCGDFAFRIEVYAAVLSHVGPGGALLRDVAKHSVDSRRSVLGRPTVEGSHCCRLGHAHAVRWRPWRDGSSAQTLETVSTAGTQLHDIVSFDSWPKRTKNASELQVAVLQWECTLGEHESKFAEVVPGR